MSAATVAGAVLSQPRAQKPAMAIYFSFQAALFFSIAHILIRRGLVQSNAMTGSLISLSMSAAILWLVLLFSVPLSALWTPPDFLLRASAEL